MRNKKGLTMLEVLASIVIISTAMVTITTLMFNSIRTSLRAKNKLLAKEVAQLYTVLVKNNLPKYNETTVFNDATTNKIYLLSNENINDASCKNLCTILFTEDSPLYKSLYVSGYEDAIELNGNKYNANNVRIEIKYKYVSPDKTINSYSVSITTTIRYDNNREVSFNDAHYLG